MTEPMESTYVVSSTDPNPDAPHDPDWPSVLEISFAAEEVRLLQGKGHGLQGAVFSFDEFDVSEWAARFEAWDADWLVEALSGPNSLAATDEAAFVETMQQHVQDSPRTSSSVAWEFRRENGRLTHRDA